MPVHSAIFRQPGPELNPMRVKVPTPIHVEVFEIERKSTIRTGQWTAREGTEKNLFKHVGQQSSPFAARYRVASLFAQQTGPWKIDGEEDPQASGYHLHLDIAEPSLCGSRFHQTMSPRPGPELAISLPDVRAGNKVLVPLIWRSLCQTCVTLFNRTPEVGDHVRVKVAGRTAIIIALADPALPAGKTQHYVLKYDMEADNGDAHRSVFTAAEIELTMFDQRHAV